MADRPHVNRTDPMHSVLRAATLLFSLVASLPALAQQPLDGTLKKIAESKQITIGFRESSTPFSYLDDNQKPVGFTIDICREIVGAIKATLGLADLDVRYVPVTAATRIVLITNGTIDMECGSTTNNAERRQQVDFTNTHFLTATRFVAKTASKLDKVADLQGRTASSTAGTNNIKYLNDINVARKLGLTILSAKDHGESFLLVETDRAAAVVLDDVLLATFVALSKNPAQYAMSSEALSPPEPYGIMLRRGDPAFKALVDDTTGRLFQSEAGRAMYDRWFTRPIPPKGVVLNMAMSPAMAKAFAMPTDSSDPAAYEAR